MFGRGKFLFLGASLLLVACGSSDYKQLKFPQTKEEVSRTLTHCLTAHESWSPRNAQGDATLTFDLICFNPDATIPCEIRTHVDSNGNGDGWGSCQGWGFVDHWNYRLGRMTLTIPEK